MKMMNITTNATAKNFAPSSAFLRLRIYHRHIFPVYEWLSAGVLKKLFAWVGRKFTVKNETETALFEVMLQEADINMVRWGIRQVLGWKQASTSANSIHIHGSNDRLFPIKYIPVNHTIHKGEHFMIIQQRETTSALLQSILA